MATFVRTQATATGAASSSTLSAATTAATAVGNTLVAVVSASGPYSVVSLTKPGSEAASWVKVSEPSVTSAGVTLEVWAIKTTVEWPAGFSVTFTLSASSSGGRTLTVAEYSGVTTSTRSGESSEALASTETVSSDGNVVPRDLAIVAGVTVTNGVSAHTTEVTQVGTITGTDPGFATHRVNQIETALMMLTVTGAGVASTKVRALNTPTGTWTTDLAAVVVVLADSNVAPNAPTLTTMSGGNAIDRAATNRARHLFSDPNYADSQSAFDIRYRVAGTTTWTTINAVTTNEFYDFPGGTFAADDYERQVRTYDAQGVVGPWSTSGFFTAADKPAGPTITYPTSGSFVDQIETVTWSTPDQDVWQLRRVADDGTGLPDAGVVYWDSGETTSATTRDQIVTFETNNRPEHLQLRVKNDGLWSDWVSVAVDVSYDAPPAPTFVTTPDTATASLLVSITNPTAGVDEEPTAYNEVWIDDGSGEERRATGVPPNGTWRYWTPRSGRDYTSAIRVVAVAANGTTASSS